MRRERTFKKSLLFLAIMSIMIFAMHQQLLPISSRLREQRAM